MNAEDKDWFEMDESEILENFREEINSLKKDTNATEYITGVAIEGHEHQTHFDTDTEKRSERKLTIGDLRKLVQLEPLDIFLYAFTFGQPPDFFVAQIKCSDSSEKVLLYTAILVKICNLKIPFFHKEILKHFVKNQNLLEQFCVIASKLFNKRYKSLWTDENINEIICYMQTLFNQAYQMNVLTPKCIDVIQNLKRIMNTSNIPDISKRSICLGFAECLQEIINNNKKIMNDVENSYVCGEAQDVFPALEELTNTNENNIVKPSKYKNILQYIEVQKKIIREDFMIPLRKCINILKGTESPQSLSDDFVFFNDVQIVINKNFLSTLRHEMLFVDILGSDREHKKTYVQRKTHKFKIGTLLCLSTNKEFENLILATVTYTNEDMLNAGYIGIDIVRQYNIGNVYNQKLFMFETPAFFEPYYNVFNFLSTVDITDIPMSQYIIFNERNPKPPRYLNEKTVYMSGNTSFNPIENIPICKDILLDTSQQLAYRKALSSDFCIIQGPPGTGKTHLSLELIKTLISNAKTPIILITYTNESLDKFLIKLSNYTANIVRFGNQIRLHEIEELNICHKERNYAVNPHLKRLYYITNLEFKQKFRKMQELQMDFDGTNESYREILSAQHDLRFVSKKLENIKILFDYYSVRHKAVIAMTTTYAARTNFLLRLLQSQIVIFEEAAEILESHTVSCLTPHMQHVIMIGDQMQLQPYTNTYDYSISKGLNISLFERLICDNMHYSVLKRQYRMRPEIADLLCPVFYKELDDADCVKKYPPVRRMSKNLYFFTHCHQENREKQESSYFNEFECTELVKLANHLVENAKYEAGDIVILSPYAKQVEVIKKKISTNKNPQMSSIIVTTVDSFQGLEATIILLSLVRNNENDIGFLKQKNRVCVALSRAKHGLYIIGNILLLAECSEIWKGIKNKLEMRNVIGNQFPYEQTAN